ncbi:MAG: Uma2 family endonuclease [Bacteroidota bacterium]
MEVLLKRHTLTVEQYHQMFDAGIITERDKVELIKGEIIDMSPIGNRHSHYVGQLTDIFYEIFGRGVVIRGQMPIQLDNLSEPEPDIALCLPPRRRYIDHSPTPTETLLVVEVSHTSLGFDQQIKLPLYAEAGIPELWILDVEGQKLYVSKQPKDGQYLSQKTYTTSDTLPVEIQGTLHQIPVSQILE